MIKNRKDWITISIFYHHDQWHKLIKKCIQPSIKEVKRFDSQTVVLFKLNYVRGENLRFSVRLDRHAFEPVVRYLHVFINNFLLATPSCDLGKVVENMLVLDFPNNTLQYNLYNDEKIPQANLNIRQTISEILVFFIQEKGLLENKIISALIYLQLLIVRAKYEEPRDAASDFECYFDVLLQNVHLDGELNRHQYSDKYGNYTEFFLILMKEVWQKNIPSSWEDEFMKNCKVQMECMDFLSVLFNVTSIIYDHLNVTTEYLRKDLALFFSVYQRAALVFSDSSFFLSNGN